MVRQGRIGVSAGGGRLPHFTRRWLACHAEIAALLGEPEPGDVAEARAILARRSPDGRTIAARPACTPDRGAAGAAGMLASLSSSNSEN